MFVMHNDNAGAENTREVEIPPVQRGVFTLASAGKDSAPHLLGGHCRSCDRHQFPRAQHCHRCLGPVDEIDLGGSGTVYSFTVVRAKPPLGLPQPYGVGFIDLVPSGLRIFSLLDPDCLDDFKIGSALALAVRPLGHDGSGRACLRPFFTLDNDKQRPVQDRL